MLPLPKTPPSLGMPPAPYGDINGNECYEVEGMFVYIHSPLPNNQFFNHNAYAKDSKCNKDFIPDLLSILSAA
jgi:hypothetical protein